ncbi:MAG: hypothetical protein F7C36_07605 [Desulfurococcales archaeon]|nr:hypothetical protein [Desulfurococcales archaeon]
MGMIEKILMPGEQVNSKLSYGGITVAASNRGILISKGSRVTIIPPRHIHAITITRNLTQLLIGITILILGIPTGIAISDIEDSIGILIILTTLLVGVPLIIYGYLRRYRLNITFAGGSITLKGSGKIIDTAKQIRKLTEI